MKALMILALAALLSSVQAFACGATTPGSTNQPSLASQTGTINVIAPSGAGRSSTISKIGTVR
jgi:hypothetical protein